MDKRLEPASAAVLVVDVQNDFCDPSGAASASGADTSAVVSMVPRLEQFLARAREVGTKIVFVRSLHDASTDSDVWLARRGANVRRSSLTCRTGSWGAELYRLTPEPQDVVVTKNRYSAFTGTNLDLVLRTARVDSLLFTGVATEVCVESSLRDALFHEYNVTLIEDCCASYHPTNHRATIEVVGRQFGLVMTSEDVGAAWSSRAGSISRGSGVVTT